MSLPGSADLADIPLDLASPPQQSVTVSNVRYDFGDTKYRLLDYQAQATSRYLEYFQGLHLGRPHHLADHDQLGGPGGRSNNRECHGQPRHATGELDSDLPAGRGLPRGRRRRTLALASGSSIPGVVGSGGTVDVRWVAPPVTALAARVL